MRIAYFTNAYPRATDTFIQREVTGLRESGLDVLTFSIRRPSKEHLVGSEQIAALDKTRYLLPFKAGRLLWDNLRLLFRRPSRYLSSLLLAINTSPKGARSLVFQIIYWQEAILLASLLERFGVDHIHNHFGDNGGTITMLASEISGIEYSLSFHGPHIFFAPKDWAIEEKLKRSAFSRSIGHFCSSQLRLFSSTTYWSKIKVIRCGIATETFAVKDTREQARRILYVGRLAAEKGLVTLFESLAPLAGLDWELTIVGSGKEEEQLKAKAESLGLADRIQFLGFRSQPSVKGLLAQSDIFVLPSFAEGIPISLMEAMASGLPVIATPVGGITELIENERTGLLVPPADADQLSFAIKRLLIDSRLRKTLSVNGRQKVERDYSLQLSVSSLKHLFLESARLNSSSRTLEKGKKAEHVKLERASEEHII